MKGWQTGVIVVVAVALVAGLFMYMPMTANIVGRADISEVMTIWTYEIADAEAGCLNISGDWHDDEDYWGCSDADFPDTVHCGTDIARVIEDMCEGMNAVWTCDRDNAYCKYE